MTAVACATQIDWSGVGAVMQGVAALIAAGAAAVTARFGVRALTAWRSEMIGRRKAELAEEIISTANEAVEAIAQGRWVASFGDEGSSYPGMGQVAEDLRSSVKGYFAPAERLLAKPELWGRTEALKFRAKAFFGDEVAEALMAILRVRIQVHNASLMLVRNVLRPDALQMSPELVEGMEKKIWDWEQPDDPFKTALAGALATVERVCGPSITERSG